MTSESIQVSDTAAECVFCKIIRGEAPATVLAAWSDAFVIEPLNPVTKGHVLVIPLEHVEDAIHKPAVTGRVMARAAQWARQPCNIITSAGSEATQTVFHLHVHVVPRAEGDGLPLPWTRQEVYRPDPSVCHVCGKGWPCGTIHSDDR